MLRNWIPAPKRRTPGGKKTPNSLATALGSLKRPIKGAGIALAYFVEYLDTSVKTIDDLKKRVYEALSDAVISLTQAGVCEAGKGKFHSGAALDWTRLDFTARQVEMTRVLRDSISARAGSVEHDKRLFVEVGGREILVESHAIPAALSVGAKACSGGRMYLYALAGAGQAGVEKALGNFRNEIERDMKLMGVTSLDQLSRDNLRWR